MRKLKRFIAALSYTNAAYKWAEEMSVADCKKFLYMNEDDIWLSVTHFKRVVVKLQYMLADELLKQENL